VSGGWLVWARWIPAWAATACLASLFSCWLKCVLALAAVGFLYCIPIARALNRLKTSHFRLVLGLFRGRGAGWTTKQLPCPSSRTSSHVFGLLAHGIVLDLLDAENRVGTRPPASICPETKRSTLRANDDRCRSDRVLVARITRRRRR